MFHVGAPTGMAMAMELGHVQVGSYYSYATDSTAVQGSISATRCWARAGHLG